MALDPDLLAQLRQLISEPESSAWPDERIEALAPLALTESGAYDIRAFAAVLWDAKAADAVEMVNTSESGSSRSMSDVFTHAQKMAERFRAPAAPGATPVAAPHSMRMVRPTRSDR